MFLKREIRIRAAAVLVAVLALASAAPAGAAGWSSDWGDAREWSSRLVPRVLAWLGLGPSPMASQKCDHGSSIDPDGCPKSTKASRTKADQGSSIDPNGWRTEFSQIDPNDQH